MGYGDRETTSRGMMHNEPPPSIACFYLPLFLLRYIHTKFCSYILSTRARGYVLPIYTLCPHPPFPYISHGSLAPAKHVLRLSPHRTESSSFFSARFPFSRSTLAYALPAAAAPLHTLNQRPSTYTVYDLVYCVNIYVHPIRCLVKVRLACNESCAEYSARRMHRATVTFTEKSPIEVSPVHTDSSMTHRPRIHFVRYPASAAGPSPFSELHFELQSTWDPVKGKEKHLRHSRSRGFSS